MHLTLDGPIANCQTTTQKQHTTVESTHTKTTGHWVEYNLLTDYQYSSRKVRYTTITIIKIFGTLKDNLEGERKQQES